MSLTGIFIFVFLNETMNRSQSFHHVDNHTDFMLTPQQSTGPNKRHWPNNGDVMNTQLSMNQLHPSKRSCMMTSFMDSTNSDNHHWIMECHQSSGYDFHIDAGDVNKRNNGSTWNGMMNGLTCDNDCENENVLMGEMDQKKQACFDSMSVKANDLIERDLLGLSAHPSPSTTLDDASSVLMQQLQQQQQQNHMHTENSVSYSSVISNNADNNVTQTNVISTNSGNSMGPSFDDVSDDINRHVQNAIDSILNLQNSENESLHYLDQTMGSFLTDNTCTPNLIHHQQASATSDFHFSGTSQASHQNSPFLS